MCDVLSVIIKVGVKVCGGVPNYYYKGKYYYKHTSVYNVPIYTHTEFLHRVLFRIN